MGGKKLKVLMTTDTVGGVWFYSLELCKVLQAQNVQVHLMALGAWPSPEQEKAVRRIPNILLYKSDYKLEWMKDPWDDVEQSRKWINSVYHTVQPDVVHLNNYAHVEQEWNTPVVTVFHSCVQTWWQAVKGQKAPHQWDQYSQTVQDSLEASDVVVSPTKSILEKAIQTHKFSSPSRVIHNGIAPRPVPSAKEEIILCLGRIWDEAKNLSLLSQIAENLSWPIYVAGDQFNPDSGTQVPIENVHFLGKLSPEEVKSWMQRASIFVSPTRYEPFGLAILEAASSGCALVLSGIDTLKELWEEAGLFFDPDNPEEAEEQLLSLMQNKNILEEFSQRAADRSHQYTASSMGASYLNLYKEIIRKKHKPISA